MPRPTILTRADFETAFDALQGAPLTLAVLDLDHFKSLNDTLGHAEGDRVLRGVERLLSGSLPTGSVIGRIGGDEYAAILPETAAETALILLDEVIKHFHIHRDPQWPRGLGLSVGLAARPAHASTYDDLKRAADEAMIRAKREGRGRACIYVESKMVLKSNYYPKSQLERLAKLSGALGRTEASLLREALDDLIEKNRGEL
ncbi:GGDEF domain-containing protein [Deinococcus soli (ex Cha et al. 2016)]|jgi:diguanylate cyclase (GGDEF)-like protein|uniref:GGDEF domain-containing protein n=1 Tax=Deinococcus soli (ex Cha et al. 2016) TaxID=1309411 RepID=UPI001669D824|nr:GGDEF domain-containing protein [Deinococcus soli (ex Cha et al. 2016)]GGB78272.1 diguanylate cyclase [Deinococcus soli (ex Cha et al. 2016)]